jgi:acylglycerol lipase
MQGGGEVLGFVTDSSQKYSTTVKLLTGLVVTSPLITQTHPASKILRWIGSKASHLTPYTLIPADLKPEVGCTLYCALYTPLTFAIVLVSRLSLQ